MKQADRSESDEILHNLYLQSENLITRSRKLFEESLVQAQQVKMLNDQSDVLISESRQLFGKPNGKRS